MSGCQLALWSALIVSQLTNPSQRAYFGIKVLELDTPVARRLGVTATQGVLVTVVRSKSPSERAGLRPGDVIVRFGDVDTPRMKVLQDLMGEAEPRTRYRVELERGDQHLQLDVVPSKPPPASAETPRTFDLGMLLAPAGSAAAIRLEVESPIGTVVTQVRPGGPADEAGLRPGDLILELGDFPTETAEDFQAAAFRSPIGSRQRVTFVRGVERLTTTIHVHETIRVDPAWSYTAPDGAYRVELPPLWYVFPIDQPDIPPERQYTRIISPYAAFELRCFHAARPAEDTEETMESFVQTQLQDGPERESGRVSMRGTKGAWVSMPLEGGNRLYRISFVAARQRYVINAIAPPLSDPARLPLPIDSIVRAIEFAPPEVAKTPAPQSPIDLPGPSSSDKPDVSRDIEPAIPSDWQAIRAGNVTFRLPADWSASPFNSADEGRWFRGKELFPDASFSLHRDTTVEEVRRNTTLRDRVATRVSGLAATQYLVERTELAAEKGMVVAVLDTEGTTPVVFALFAPSGKFEELEPVLRMILGSVQITEETVPEPKSDRPSRETKSGANQPRPPTE